MTDNAGRAVAQVVPNKVAGDMPIHVAAKFHTLEANTVIHAQNAALAGGAAGAAGGAAISGKLLAVILIAAGGIAGGVIAATRGGGSSPATITAGTPTVGAPR
jgi:urease beta subunit